VPRSVSKNPAPLSVRLTQAERDALLVRAGGQTLSAYVKRVLFDETLPPPRGGGLTVANRTLLAHLLATLGGSRIAPNLAVLADEANSGNLFADAETVERINEALDDVRLMHNALMRGLGMRQKSLSFHEFKAFEEFNAAAKPEDHK
jgi:hypothetical protein